VDTRKSFQVKEAVLFSKKEPKNFCSFGPSLSGKAEAKTDRSFLLLFFKKEDFLSQSNSSVQADRIKKQNHD
jgi:hypothetical protein